MPRYDNAFTIRAVIVAREPIKPEHMDAVIDGLQEACNALELEAHLIVANLEPEPAREMCH